MSLLRFRSRFELGVGSTIAESWAVLPCRQAVIETILGKAGRGYPSLVDLSVIGTVAAWVMQLCTIVCVHAPS